MGIDYLFTSISNTMDSIFIILVGIIIIVIAFFFLTVIILYISKRKTVDKHTLDTFDLFESIKTKEDILKELEIVDKLKLVDSKFNRETFKSWVKMTFVKVQEALSDGKFKDLKVLETNELFEQHKALYSRNKLKNNQKRVIEKINIDTVLLYDLYRINSHDVVSVFINVYMIEYIKDLKSNRIIKGSDEEYINKSYTLTFIRKIDKKVVMDKNNSKKIETINCPKCGAPLSVTSIGTCEYCKNYIKLNSFNWLLSDITFNLKNMKEE